MGEGKELAPARDACHSVAVKNRSIEDDSLVLIGKSRGSWLVYALDSIAGKTTEAESLLPCFGVQHTSTKWWGDIPNCGAVTSSMHS